MWPVRKILAVVLMGGALLLAACGGDDDSPEKAESPPARTEAQTETQAGGVTRAEYIKRADRFCAVGNKRAKRLNGQAKAAVQRAKTPDEQFDAYIPLLRKGLAFQREQNAAFKRIEGPAADRQIIARFHAAFDRQTALLGQMLEAAEARNGPRFRAIAQEQRRVSLTARPLARDYGFEECGSGKNEAD
jgi:hypothetical protein